MPTPRSCAAARNGQRGSLRSPGARTAERKPFRRASGWKASPSFRSAESLALLATYRQALRQNLRESRVDNLRLRFVDAISRAIQLDAPRDGVDDGVGRPRIAVARLAD